MGADGLLKDPSGTTVTTKPSNDYRYPGTDSVINNDIQKQIDEEKRKKEESEKKIKDLEEKKTTAPKSTTLQKKETKNEKQDAIAAGPSSVTSLVEWF